MGYLAIEIIALLGGAAVLGFVIGWGIFGLGKKPAAGSALSSTNPKLESDFKSAVDARKKAEARIIELEAKESNFTDRLQERDAKVAELSHQLDDLARYRVEAASDKDNKDQRIAALEGQLRQRDADLAQVAAGNPGGATALDLQQQVADRERTIARLKSEVETLQATSHPDAPKVGELQAEIAELRATLVATAGAAPTTASEKDAIIGRLNEEVTGLRAAYEAAEQALEEQDAAIDKLTRDLVNQQQRVAQLEGHDAPSARPRSGVTPRPASTPSIQVTQAIHKVTTQITENERTVAVSLSDIVAKVDSAPSAKPIQVEYSESTVAIPLADLVKQIETREQDIGETVSEANQAGIAAALAAKRAATAPTPPPMQVEANESTVAISIADLIDKVDAAPAAKPPTPPPMQVEVNESTVAISIADLIDKVDATPAKAAAKPPGPPPMQVEVNESTVAISIADIVDKVDAAPAKKPPTPPPMQVEENESTVAVSLSDLVDKIDARPSMQVEENERTVAFVVPTELLEDDGDDGPRADSNDLRRIKGIGKATAKRLRSAGITTWAQVATLKESDLPAIADLLKVSVDKIKPWVEQAKSLRG